MDRARQRGLDALQIISRGIRSCPMLKCFERPLRLRAPEFVRRHFHDAEAVGLRPNVRQCSLLLDRPRTRFAS